MKGNPPIGASVHMRLVPSSLSVSMSDWEPEPAAVISIDATLSSPRRLTDLRGRDLKSIPIYLRLHRISDALVESGDAPSRAQYLGGFDDPESGAFGPQCIAMDYFLSQPYFDRLLGALQAGLHPESLVIEVEGQCLSFDDSPLGDGFVWNLAISKHLAIGALRVEGLRQRAISQDMINRMNEVMDMMLSNDFIQPDHVMGASGSVIQTIRVASDKVASKIYLLAAVVFFTGVGLAVSI